MRMSTCAEWELEAAKKILAEVDALEKSVRSLIWELEDFTDQEVCETMLDRALRDVELAVSRARRYLAEERKREVPT